MKNKTRLLILSASLALATCLSAKPEEGKGDRTGLDDRFNRMDTNSDGALSMDEVKGPLAKKFEELDTDGDGSLTKEEIAAIKGQRDGENRPEPGERFDTADTDGNGSLSLSEIQAAKNNRMAKNFDKIDADGDGELSKDELKSMGDKIRKMRQSDSESTERPNKKK